MATCTLRLYNSAKIEEEKNFKFDTMTDSAGELLPELGAKVYEEENFQYQRIELDKKIKIEIDQAAAIVRTINYASITETVGTGQTKTFYYFVRNARQLAQKTVELTMRLDTLNTFAEGVNYVITERSQIIREHKPRFYDLSPMSYLTEYRDLKVDIADEPFDGLFKEKKDTQTITDRTSTLSYNQSWYIAYRSTGAEATSPIQILLIPELDVISVRDGLGTNVVVRDVSKIDFSDQAYSKIIECPYCPIELTYIEQLPGGRTAVSLPVGWTTVNLGSSQKFIALDPSYLYKNDKFKNSTFAPRVFGAPSVMPFYEEYPLRRTPIKPDNESKLHAHQFETEKLVYDSFALQFLPERLVPDDEGNVPRFDLEFVLSDSFSSAFAVGLKKNGNGDYLTGEDYDVLISTRNNELPLYTNNYLNYKRTSYNYDEKLKGLSVKSSISSAISSGVSNLTSGVLNLVTKDYGRAFSSGLTVANTVYSTVQSIQAANIAIEAKRAELAAQAASVAGAEDLSLFRFYAKGNRLNVMTYSVPDAIKEMLVMFFHRYGYATKRRGVPNHNTRIHFDYVQADAEIDSIDLYEDFTADLVDKFKNGVTYFHECPVDDDDELYDTDQIYENYEKELVTDGE